MTPTKRFEGIQSIKKRVPQAPDLENFRLSKENYYEKSTFEADLGVLGAILLRDKCMQMTTARCRHGLGFIRRLQSEKIQI